ncbi:MAG: arginine--tRNA ligase [Candidatus Saccharimonas sp.]
MNQIADTLRRIVQKLYELDIEVHVERPDPQFGDAATNIALQIAKQLARNPREVADTIAEEFRATNVFQDVTVAGPGFINLKLTDSELLNLAQGRVRQSLTGVRTVVEYSCPNYFKELHTGHLYQTIFGDILCRILEATGAEVSRTSFSGDVGLHVAKCLWGIVTTLEGEYPEKLETIEASAFARAQWISQCYVRGAGAYEEDESAKRAIDELNVRIYGFHENSDHDSTLAQIYWTTRQWSYDYFTAFYEMIHVDQMRYYPESATVPIGMRVVNEQLEKNNLQRSEGAVVFVGDEEKHLHTRVFVTSRGLPTYETKDIGVIWLEREDYHFDRRVIVTGNDQKEYMRVVFAAAETFDPSLSGTMMHLTNGTVRFGDGTKMSSRLGNVSRAIDVIDIVREKVRELVQDESLVETVALGAVKYVFAKYRIGGDIAFDIEETVSLAGNSGPYIQYAHARACSIVAKATQSPTLEGEYDAHERTLLAKIGEYAEVVEHAATELSAHGICSYLYELAQEFNRFYENSRIVGDEREALRLGLVMLYRDTLARGLGLLGIVAPAHL